MLIFIKRLLALILIPVALILLLAPFNTFRKTYMEKNFVFLIAEPAFPVVGNSESRPLPLLSRRQLECYPHIYAVVSARKKSLEKFGLLPETAGNPAADGSGTTVLSCLRRQWETEPADISAGEWERLADELLVFGGDHAGFRFAGVQFRGIVKNDCGLVKQEIPGLAAGRKIAASVSLAAGLLLLAGLYFKKPGIMIAQTWNIILWDVIVIVFSLYFIYGALDMLFMKIFGTRPATEEFIRFMGIFWVLAAIPAAALFISATAAQAVSVDEKAVRLDGLFSKKVVFWDELKKIEVTELYSAKKAAETVAPEALLKVMIIEGETTTITLMEPPRQVTKERILKALLNYAPARWQEVVKEQGQAWQAFF